MQKIIVAAVAQNGVIGNKGIMPWHSSEDFKYFKSLTFGNPVIMGRKTLESLGKPLKGRLNIIISRTMKSESPDVMVFSSLAGAYEYCENEIKAEKIFIIGGGDIFKEAIKSIDEMSISRMKFEAEGDVYFPAFEASEFESEVKAEYEDFQVIWYKRK